MEEVTMHDKHGKHKMHEKHKSEHHSKMIDNRKMHDSHQQGIERVKQRPGDMEVGQHGKMGKSHHGDTFKRGGGSLTPRKA
jgi:hypothetical protein